MAALELMHVAGEVMADRIASGERLDELLEEVRKDQVGPGGRPWGQGTGLMASSAGRH